MNLTLFDGVTADGTTKTVPVRKNDLPVSIVAGGMQAGETVEVYKQPFDDASFAALKSGGSTKVLDADNNEYLIESAGIYQVKFVGSGGGASAAGLEVGIQG